MYKRNWLNNEEHGSINYKTKTMEKLLYIIAVIFILGWIIGYVGYNLGGLIHILLVIAVIAVLLRIIRGKDPL